jgi:dCMP deaminase
VDIAPDTIAGVVRPTWDETWLGVAREFAGRSLCVRSQVAAVIVTPDNLLASVGYNGPPSGMNLSTPCTEWCPRGRETTPSDGRSYGLSCVTIHAEINALIRCDWRAMQGGTLYGTRTPCHDCVKVIGNSGIKRAVFPVLDIDSAYDPEHIIKFLQDCGVAVTAIDWTPIP